MSSLAAVNNMGGYAHNPRGNLWLNDDSTFGHKLLLKMGWHKGKGLGKHENGVKENIKVKIKHNNSGVGWMDKSYANIQNVEYDSPLKSISAEYSNQRKILDSNENDEESCRSLEDRSQAFKNRLHYQKFIRGKDLSKYSAEDMKSIFIFQKDTAEKNQESHDSPCQGKEETNSENKPLNLTETYNSKLSISDYFAQKMKAKKMLKLEVNSNKGTIIQPENSDKAELSLPKHKISSKKKRKIIKESLCETMDFNDKLNQAAITQCKNAENNELLSLKEKKISSKRKRKLSEESVCKKMKFNVKVNQAAVSQCNNAENNELPPLKQKKMSSKQKRKLYEDSVCKDLTKKKKKMKKLRTLEKLKSCLKHHSKKYCINKNVSFNDTVSYQIINPNSVYFECDSNGQTTLYNGEEITQDGCVNYVASNSGSITEIQNIEELEHNTILESYSVLLGTSEESIPDTSKQISDAEQKEKETEHSIDTKSNSECVLFELPTSNSPNYTCWIESQKQALKMKSYKTMLKKIRKHKILRTTNLLSIKGYGNWGF